MRPGGLLLLALCLLGGPSAIASPAPGDDGREIYSSEAPGWLRAVGKLEIPGIKMVQGRRNHYREDCSATLVARPSARQADTLVTAWHCLEFHRDLSQPIVFTLLPGTRQSISGEAYRLADGGGMHADWALLRLYRAVPRTQVDAVTINPLQADPGRPVTMAGYSRDAIKGAGGERLTFDARCTITAQSRTGSDTDCTAHKGASGGAVVQSSHQGKPLFTGVISRGDSAGLSIYMPVTGFRNALQLHLR